VDKADRENDAPRLTDLLLDKLTELGPKLDRLMAALTKAEEIERQKNSRTPTHAVELAEPQDTP
jgi:hypothetical protein